MGTRQFFCLAELEDIINDPNFFDDDEPDAVIDIVELPPDNVDVISDFEDMDDEILEDTHITDVPGRVEVHSSAIPIPSTSQQKEDENKSTTKPQKITKKRKIIKTVSDWRKTNPEFMTEMGNDDEVSQRRDDLVQSLRGKSPVEVFETLFDEDIITYIVKQSVMYASQGNRHDFTFSADCLKKFLGILLLTGYHSLPQEQMYWCEDEDMDIRSVRKCMTRNRYLQIKRNLHFNDHLEISSTQSTNKIFKIGPLIDKMNEKFLKFGIFSKNLSIDEQMIRYYGHHYLKQFIRGKPIRFGFKQWIMCCAETGYCFHAELYQGKQEREFEINSLGSSVIMSKIAVIDHPSNHTFYFDNFFTSFELMKQLTDRKISATGTVRYNRMNHCPIKADNDMKKEHRGAFDYRFDLKNEIFATVWKDNNCVKVLSNHQGIQPLQKVKRWSRTEKKHVNIPQPHCIDRYNKYMGGVDKMDWLTNKYRIKIRGKKWYFPIFTNIIDMTIVNAHVLYCLANEKIPLLEFRRSIARTYLQILSISTPKNAGRPCLQKSANKRVPEDIRKDSIGHYLERTNEGKQRKCAVCKLHVRKQCSKCNVGLHVECMVEWHQ